MPRVEDDGKTLRCVYEQFDSEGNSLFPGNQKDMDEVELSVDFLEKPLEDALPIERSAQVKKRQHLWDSWLLHDFLFEGWRGLHDQVGVWCKAHAKAWRCYVDHFHTWYPRGSENLVNLNISGPLRSSITCQLFPGRCECGTVHLWWPLLGVALEGVGCGEQPLCGCPHYPWYQWRGRWKLHIILSHHTPGDSPQITSLIFFCLRSAAVINWPLLFFRVVTQPFLFQHEAHSDRVIDTAEHKFSLNVTPLQYGEFWILDSTAFFFAKNLVENLNKYLTSVLNHLRTFVIQNS